MTIKFKLPNYLLSYTTKGKLRDCIATEKFEATYGDLTQTGITATQCVTTKPQHSLYKITYIINIAFQSYRAAIFGGLSYCVFFVFFLLNLMIIVLFFFRITIFFDAKILCLCHLEFAKT